VKLMDIGLSDRIGDAYDLKAFGERLRMLRRSPLAAQKLGVAEISGNDFARRLGIARVRYYRYELGQAEPPVWVVGAIGKLTGVSLDWLLLGKTNQGALPYRTKAAEQTESVTAADRLRWIREAVSPIVEECAGYFGIDPETWRAYERADIPLPVEFAKEVAIRFPVTLDYLYSGDLAGLEPQVEYVLIKAHPELNKASTRSKPRAQSDSS
jgi:transcriptional regulator with XRE-family HTH domain